jgi:hypothetical protein
MERDKEYQECVGQMASAQPPFISDPEDSEALALSRSARILFLIDL